MDKLGTIDSVSRVQLTTGGRIWPGPGMTKFGRGRELAVLGFGRGWGRKFPYSRT